MVQKKKDPRTALSQKIDRELEERTKQALEENHRLFAQEHSEDSDDQLLEYVRQCAGQIGHSPCSGEIIGGPYILKRLGLGWGRVLQAANLPPADDPPLPQKKWQIYKKEYRRQVALHRQQKQSKAKEKQEKRGSKS